MKNLINTRRKELGLTITALAAKTNMDQSLLSRIISGQRKATTKQLLSLSIALDIDATEIITQYIARDVENLIKPYPELAPRIMKVAEERVAYLSSNKVMKTIDLSKSIEEKLSYIDKLRLNWAAKKPLNETQLVKMQEYFNTRYTFESNKIEGNTLSYRETHLVINEGITIGGKSMREHLEAINHQEAILLMQDMVQKNASLNSHSLKQLHQLILKGIDSRNAGIYRNIPVRIAGSDHLPPEPYKIDKMMEDYFLFYTTRRKTLHPVILAAEMHERLVTIHPFVDGNGRTSRLIMNLILLQNGCTIANLKGDYESRMRYYNALEKVQLDHESSDFYEMICDYSIASLEEHIELAG